MREWIGSLLLILRSFSVASTTQTSYPDASRFVLAVKDSGLWIVATFSSTNAFLERIRLGESVEEDATNDGSVLRSQVALGVDEAARVAVRHPGWSEDRAEREVRDYREWIERYTPKAPPHAACALRAWPRRRLRRGRAKG